MYGDTFSTCYGHDSAWPSGDRLASNDNTNLEPIEVSPLNHLSGHGVSRVIAAHDAVGLRVNEATHALVLSGRGHRRLHDLQSSGQELKTVRRENKLMRLSSISTSKALWDVFPLDQS